MAGPEGRLRANHLPLVPWQTVSRRLGDSKLRGCDVVGVRVDDVAPNGYALDRATVRPKKTGRPVQFELTNQTRQAINEYLRLTCLKPGELLFPGRRDSSRGMTTRQCAANA